MPDTPKPWGKIVVGTRLEKQVDNLFFTCWTELVMKGLRKGDGILTVKNKVAHHAANYLAQAMLKTGADTILFVDSDAEFDKDVLSRFRDYEPGWEYDVLQAFYVRRGWPPEPIWFKEDSDGDFVNCMPVLDEGVDDVAAVGLHCTLVRREVFERIRGLSPEIEPDKFEWFTYPRHRPSSEDTNFSREAIAAGFRVGATVSVRFGHIGSHVTNWDTYQEWARLSGTRARLDTFHHLAQLVADFTGETKDEVVTKALKGHKNTVAGWE